jgi:hypothetical protein
MFVTGVRPQGQLHPEILAARYFALAKQRHAEGIEIARWVGYSGLS